MRKPGGYSLERIVRVGMGEIKVVSPPEVLSAILGSCIGLVIYDEERKIAGMAHIMLPRVLKSSRLDRGELRSYPGKYASYAVPALVKELRKRGAFSLKAKMAGGANMFPELQSAKIDVGGENAKAARSLLEEFGIPLVSEDVGGNRGRSIFFDPENSVMIVRVGDGESYII